MSEIRLESVSKSFGIVRALEDVSLDVAQGELVTLLGPSGCGKTTLLRIVAGLETPTAGRVRFGGVDVTDRATRERPIGLVFQSYALFPNLTVRQNISFPLEVRRRPSAEIRRRIAELLDLVRLSDEADRYPNQISGGQAQRCALARALAPDPEVLLLDEPLSALDVLVRTHLRDEIRRIQRRVGTTTIYVTHDQSEALAIADRVAVMERGRIEQVGTPRDVYRAPVSRFAASFVGNRNAIEVKVRDGRVRLGAMFEVPAPATANGRVVSYFAPESVRVAARKEGGPSGLSAVVEEIGFHGALTRLSIGAVVDDHRVRINADVPSSQAAGFEVGSEVVVRVDPADVSCFSPSVPPTHE